MFGKRAWQRVPVADCMRKSQHVMSAVGMWQRPCVPARQDIFQLQILIRGKFCCRPIQHWTASCVWHRLTCQGRYSDHALAMSFARSIAAVYLKSHFDCAMVVQNLHCSGYVEACSHRSGHPIHGIGEAQLNLYQRLIYAHRWCGSSQSTPGKVCWGESDACRCRT